MFDTIMIPFSNCSLVQHIPDSKVHGANMGPNWVLSAPDGPHIGPMNLAIRDLRRQSILYCRWLDLLTDELNYNLCNLNTVCALLCVFWCIYNVSLFNQSLLFFTVSLLPAAVPVKQLWRIWFINLDGPNDAVCRHRFESTLSQIMDCCLTAPSHYLKQFCTITSEALWHSSDRKFTGNTQDNYPRFEFEH